MHYLFYISLGLLPSFLWLSFYLKKDRHPEPNSMILKIFIWGMLVAPIAVILEIALIWLVVSDYSYAIFNSLSSISPDNLIKIFLVGSLIPAIVEEYLKYKVVKWKVLKDSEFDEPTDAMLYCLIAGLGFAAVENLLILFKISFPNLEEAFSTITMRFLGATLVHALASAIVGYWLAKGILYINKRRRVLLIGLAIAIIFHGSYNYLILTTARQELEIRQTYFLLGLVVLLLLAASLVSYYFKKLKKQQSICLTHE